MRKVLRPASGCSNAFAASNPYNTRDHRLPERDPAISTWHPLVCDKDAIIVLDDLPARQGAEALSIPVTGTLGVVIHGVRSGFLTPAQGIEIVNSLLSIGARLDPLLVRKVIELISL